MPGNENDSSIVAAREVFSSLREISQLLNTGLDSETLALCVRLCELGVNPEALAVVIRELKKETAALRAVEASNQANN